MRPALEFALGATCFAAAIGLSLPEAPPAAPPAPVAQRPPLPQAPARLTASYTLTVRLDPEEHRIVGEGTIHFENTSNAALHSLFFHLYLNAFKNDRTLFLRSPFGAGRSGQRPNAYGYVDVQRLSARELGGLDLWAQRAAHSPGDPDDETDIEVPLPEALPPGARLTLDVRFEAVLPALIERTGHRGRFHFMGQWFPKLAKLEPDGRFEHFAFHPHAEFYADFGAYDVTLDVPEAFVVGASGVRQSERVAGGRRVERYVAAPVHDFAWTAWDQFIEQRVTAHGVEIRLLHPPGHARNRARTLAALSAALPHFAAKYGPYPYETLTVVHPPRGAEPAGGMEYPTLITTGGPWYLPYTGIRALEAVTVHELGHQWFYGLLASNEVQEPFLDEGLTSYAETSLLSRWLGPASGARLFGLSVSTLSLFRAISQERGGDETIGKSAPEFSSFQNLGALVYARTAVLLETLGRVFGQDRLDRALLDYATRHRFGHPTGSDLLAAIAAHVGEPARLLAQQALFERGHVNYLVREIQNAPERAPSGFFERNDGRERIVPDPQPMAGFRSSVTVYRQGALEIPVEVLLIAADGSRRLVHWDGKGAFRTFQHTGASPLSRVVVDPEQKILLDAQLLDNQVARNETSLSRLSTRLAYWGALGVSGVVP